MLKRICSNEKACVKIKDANFPAPFGSELEYCSPARGTWNIVHTGMLVPGSHQIYICAESCLRGVVLTAAEMGAEERFSCVSIRENNVLDGDMEQLIIDGVTDVLNKLPQKPTCMMVFTSCIHHFMGCDLSLVYRELRKRFPDVPFADCYMNPIMRKSGLTPDQLLRRQMYSFLAKLPTDVQSVNIIGNDFATDETSELVKLIKKAGWTLRDVTACRTYDEYLMMGSSEINITYNAAAKAAGDELKRRLGQEHMYLPVSYDYARIKETLNALAKRLGVPESEWTQEAQRADAAMKKAKEAIGDTTVDIDYTLTLKPLGLARLLLSRGFKVRRVYLDGISSEEKDDFEALRSSVPDLELWPTVDPLMRVSSRESAEKTLALGQKAAYFTGTPYFVNIVEGGGMYGFDGIARLAGLMEEAFAQPKDTRKLIQIKGLGCGCSI
jgi:hypothetical protein